MKKRKQFLAGMLAVFLAASGIGSSGMTVKADSCGGLAEEDVYTPGDDEVIKDPLLHWAIRSSMNAIKSNVKLTADMVGDKSVRNISFELCSHADDFADWEKPYWIKSLEGIQYAKSATMVDIGYTAATPGKSIDDLSYLSPLTQLDILILKQDGITDVSALKTLVNLSQLDLSMNYEIKDVSAIKDMKKLSTLNLSSNAIENVDDVENLTKLQYLDISKNKISELPDMSKLAELRTLLASGNELTDVTTIGQLKNLEVLDLTSNSGITDVKALAGLTHLDEERTYMPTAEMKTDLFAAINVNKIFELFNISKMTSGDLENVQKALDTYEALSKEQKTYIETAKVEAAKNNKAKVEAGEEPDYYPEYDNGGVKQPVLDQLEIKVVDKKGNPLPNVNFIRKRVNVDATPSEYQISTNENGILKLKHTAADAWYNNIIVEVDNSGDVKYISNPEKIEYTVNASIQTETLNGKAATGLEELQFVLIPEDEYVDKAELENALKRAEEVEEDYKYTEETYNVYANALANAQKVFNDVDASETDVQNATKALVNALDGLKRADKLTTLKVIVKDANGNLFTRPFKFQYTSDKGGYNAWSDAYTGVLYLPASAAWEDGETWKLFPCYQELYSADPVINFTVGKENGKSYFKEINGESVGVDYEKEIVVTWTGITTPGFDPITPDSTVLKEIVEQMKSISSDGYTPASFDKLAQAISKAEAIADKADATQEDFNAAVAELKEAEANLLEVANKVDLAREIANKTSYSQENYVSTTWPKYVDALADAEKIYQDGNATQTEVDNALQNLKDAEKQLILRGNKSGLETTLQTAKGLDENDYESGWDNLQTAILNAEKVIANVDATTEDVNSANAELTNAMNGLKKKPKEYPCVPGVFYAKVVDAAGNPIKGAKFQAVVDGVVDDAGDIISNEEGIIAYYLWGDINSGKTTYIRLVDDNYTTENEHYFTASGATFLCTMSTIDGKPYAEGTKLIYTLKKKNGGDTPAKVEKDALQSKVDELKDMKQGNYTLNSYKALKTALTEAETALDNPNATQAEVDSALAALEAAQNNLKTVQGMQTLKIAVVSEDGSQLPGNIKFIRDNVKYYVQTNMFANDGALVWTLNGYEDAGEYEIYLPEGSAYIATPVVTKITVGKEDGTSVIEKINGVPAAEAQASIRLLAKSKDACDKVTFRAQVQDEDGTILSGVQFNVKNGDPNVLISDENGILQYDVTAWDIDTEMTVSLGENDKWACDKQVVFKVADDPEAPGRGIISEINGNAFTGGEKITFVLVDKNKPQPVDKTALVQAIQEAEAFDKDIYTEETYGVLENALSEAVKVVDNSEATQEEVDNAVKALRDAIDGLVKKEVPVEVDKINLENAIKDAQAVKKDDYTEESYKVLDEALKAALKVEENPDATQAEVDNAEKVVRDAIKGLVTKTKDDSKDDSGNNNPNKDNSDKNNSDKNNSKNPTTNKPSKDKNNNVKTGDTANVVMPIVGIGFAVLLFALAVMLRKRSHR